MHIVIANQWYPPESGWGGVAMYNHAVAQAYRSLGHRVTVIARRNAETTPAYTETDGIHVHRLLTRDYYYLRQTPFAGYYSRALQQLFYSWRLRRALKQLNRTHRIDIVEFAEINAEGYFFARAPWVPFVVRCHTPTFVLRESVQPGEALFDTKIISACEQQVIRRAHALTAPSSDMAGRIARATGVKCERITVVPNPLGAANENGNGHRPQGLASDLTVLYVGRIERAKGILALAEAIPAVVSRIPHARFLIAGYDRSTPCGTSQRAEVEDQLAACGVRASVEFLGAVVQSKLGSLYQRADLCVVPALQYESFSYTCAQAMAAGKPVISTRVGGIPETLGDGGAGLLVEPDKPEELVEAIIQLLNDRDKRLAMGRAGRERVLREFDPLKVARKNLDVYAEARQAFECLTA
ncbi:MAG TPA: glycosyltransferase family 4 protein [Pyrinomonadaceae bacterium]|nr:glycosyltransferase family 4 protein [Pyrinomonadaceae bacterium]